ncbi:MAG: hypothetical protein GF418_10470 [Chitinivibrionales bacterium]|nr:hypothetical protein [Chitinivibrionales bacterium]MBD3396037.1 hypothetical protein [Chitinivibrionales bacterium]
MHIEHIQGLKAYDIEARTARQKSRPVAPASRRKTQDSYEPSSTRETDQTRKLADIRRKVRSGYYSSDEVTDDLGESFAKVFDKLL